MTESMPPAGPEGFWTNPSVLALAGDRDPVEAISELAQHVVLAAVDSGWQGPPFDPFALAEIVGIPLEAHQGLADARTTLARGSQGTRSPELNHLLGPEPPPVLIEYNPTRPRGRLRYNLAHEIAHTFFPDVAETVRHRTGSGAVADVATSDDWQLELLCNIAAGELLMPTDTLSGLDDQEIDIDALMVVRARFDVSTEALLRRVAAQTRQPLAVFAASRIRGSDDESSFRLDYIVGSRTYSPPIRRGLQLPATSVLGECAAIGYTARGVIDASVAGADLAVQCVGLAAYPGHTLPRVAGIVRSDVPKRADSPKITYVAGDATRPRGTGNRMIAHVVNDQATRWGRSGFANALGEAHDHVRFLYSTWVLDNRENLRLGNVHFGTLPDGIIVASMVAQAGYGPSQEMRLRYEALEECLRSVAREALMTKA